jgi:transcriptional regulator with XRE-family HTH domain
MKQQTKEQIGLRIRDVRKKNGLTMSQLADRVGVSYITIYRIETGKVSPSVVLLSEIAHSLGEPITAFFEQDQGKCILIKAEEQTEIEAHMLNLKLLIPKGLIDDSISISIGKANKGKCIDRHKNNGFELSYIIEGKCIFRYGNVDHEMKEGDVIYFDGKTVHSVFALEPLKFLAIYFREIKSSR